MPTLTHFHDLDAPEKGTNQWFVRSSASNHMAYLLNFSQHLADMNDYSVDDFLFKTEAAAHTQAAAYYKHHGKDYPYHTKWQNAIVVGDAKKFVNDYTSQTMEFI